MQRKRQTAKMLTPSKEMQIRELLKTTNLPPKQIAKNLGVTIHHVFTTDHKFDDRVPGKAREFSEKLRSDKLRGKRRIVQHLSPELKKKMISENAAWFAVLAKKYFDKNRKFFRTHGIENGDILNDFVVYIIDRIEIFDYTKSKFTTWAKVWFDSFALSYIPNLLRREKAEQGYRLGVQKAQPKYAKLPPRGYGLIPANIRSIWRLLGLRLETAIRFGPDETATAVSYIAHEAGLTKKQENVITLLLEGIPENNAGKRIGITVQAVNSLKLSAIGRMKKFIEEKRNNSAH